MKLDLGGNPEEVAGIGASHVCDTANLALAPEQMVIVELRNATEMHGGDGGASTLAQTGQGSDHPVSTGRERDGAVEFDGRPFRFRSHPCGPERLCQLAMREIGRASCREKV